MDYIKNRITNKNFLILLASDIILIISAFFSSVLLRYEFSIPTEIILFISPQYFIVFILIKIALFKNFGLYRGMWRYTSIWDMANVVKSNILSSIIVVSLILFFSSFDGISRAIFILDCFICTTLIGSTRLGVRLFFSHILYALNNNENYKNRKKVLLIGAGDTAQIIVRQILQKEEKDLSVVGFLDDNINKIGSRLHDLPVLGSIDILPTLDVDYDEIFICTPYANGDQMRRIFDLCKKNKKPFKTLPSISELVNGDVSISQFREVSLVDLLGRDEVEIDVSLISSFINGKRVLITGAGGSIGSELVRQCIKFEPSVLVMLDNSELNLFKIDREVKSHESKILFKPILSDIRDINIIDEVFKEFEPQIVFHAAAYKHVPIQEYFPSEAIKTNVFGTSNVSEVSAKYDVEKFVLVSTDKAVKPANVMGATKRLSEMIIQNYNKLSNNTDFMAVRFGNVLGSSGSVIPIFQDQIKKGGPITVTDPDMERYFMSIPEASQLILQAGSIGIGGEVFILDMGSPIKIIDIANELIRLSGYEPELDIPIKFTGTRPGEKKIEELSLPTEHLDKTKHDKIFVLNDQDIGDETLSTIISDINNLKDNDLSGKSASQIRLILSSILTEYDPDINRSEQVYSNTKVEA